MLPEGDHQQGAHLEALALRIAQAVHEPWLLLARRRPLAVSENVLEEEVIWPIRVLSNIRGTPARVTLASGMPLLGRLVRQSEPGQQRV